MSALPYVLPAFARPIMPTISPLTVPYDGLEIATLTP